MSNTAPPVFFFAFANPGAQSADPLPSLNKEAADISAALATGAQNGSWEFVSSADCRRADLFETFRNNRVAVFHFGGHSNQQSLWLPRETPGNQVVDGGMLEEFLSTQSSLQLAFFNSCENQAWAAKLSARVPFVIASVCKLDDAIAGHFAAAFYGYLASGSTVDDAFSQAAGDVMGTHQSSLADWVDKYKQNPPQFRSFDEAEDFPTPAQASFPWVAVKRPGASANASWRLADIAHDPLIGLPQLVPGSYDLPPRPYVTIKGHGIRDSALFFGRSAEIRALADWALGTADPARPISLFYGQSGVGKSSLLNAGLLPRLRGQCLHAYRRRNRNLIDDLYSAIAEILAPQPPAPGAPASQASMNPAAADPAMRNSLARDWLNLPQHSLILLDQVEEAITHAIGSGNAAGEELRAFADHVRQLFSSRPPGSPARLLLSFRKEYLAEIRGCFAQGSADNAPDLLDHFWLDRLGHDAIVQVVTGAAFSRLTRDTYKIVFPEGGRLPNLIADDMLKGDSSIATILQIVLNELWDAARPDANGLHAYTLDLYEKLAIRANPLQGFYEQQLAALYTRNEGKGAAQGLELDLLFGHTSELGTSRRRSLDDLKKDYPRLAAPGSASGLDLDKLLASNKDFYLLTEPATDPGGTQADANSHSTALAHDTLAPLIRRDFALSVLPGARARRLLENRAREWAGKKKATVLDRADLRTVERGLSQMRVVTGDEQRLIQASRTARWQSLARSFVLLLLLPIAAIGYTIFWVHSERLQQQTAIDASATAIQNNDQVIAIAETLEAERIQRKDSWLLQFDPTGTNAAINKSLIDRMQKVLAFREVYRAKIDDSMVVLDRCVVTLDEKDRPLVTSRNGATVFHGYALPASLSAGDAACDPASGTIFIPDANSDSISVWHDGKTQTLQFPEPQTGPMTLGPNGAVLAYGAGPRDNPSAQFIAFLDLSTGKLSRKIPGISTGNRVAFSSTGRYLIQDSDKQGLAFLDLQQPNPAFAALTPVNAQGRAAGSVDGQEAVAFGGKGLAGGDLQIRRLGDGKLFTFDDRMAHPPDDDVEENWSGYSAVALSPDGKMLAAYSSLALGEIQLWAVPSTLDPPGSGDAQSADPAILRLRQGPKNEGSPLHLEDFSVPLGLWNLVGVSADHRFVVTAELQQIPSSGQSSDADQPKQAAYIHVWQVAPPTAQELKSIKLPYPLFDTGCQLIGNFIDDMAANTADTVLPGTGNINYTALSKACKQGAKQQNTFGRSKIDEKSSAGAKPAVRKKAADK